MTKNVKMHLKERTRLTMHYYKNDQKIEDNKKALKKTENCTKEIVKAKTDYILQMNYKINDPKTAQKHTGIS